MSSVDDRLKPFRFGILFSLLTVMFGFGLGAFFGIAESGIKTHLQGTAEERLVVAYQNDATKIDPVIQKSWSYIKRSHLHAGAIGTAALASTLLLAHLGVGLFHRFSAAVFGVGGLLYSLYWLLAGLRTPYFGSTTLAKESVEWLAVPGAGLVLLGLVGTIVCVLRTLYFPRKSA